jgi:dethiobiotin synthetase
MTRGVFVTATDTGVGKTVAAVAILRGLARAGIRAVGMKPVSAGAEAPSGLNADVVALASASSVDAPLADRNPFAFALPIAPHLAAAHEARPIGLAQIVTAYRALEQRADAIVVEGAGGALVPLDDRDDMLDIARALRLPVLLCVGVRLGCLHQARATALAVRARGLALCGWVACRIDARMPFADENVRWLARELPAPLVAEFTDGEPPPLAATALAAIGLLEGDATST